MPTPQRSRRRTRRRTRNAASKVWQCKFRRRLQGTDHVVQQLEVPGSNSSSRFHRGAVWSGRMSRRHRATLSAWQKQLVDELRSLARGHPDEIRIVQQPPTLMARRVRLSTKSDFIPQTSRAARAGWHSATTKSSSSRFTPCCSCLRVSKLITPASSGSRTSSRASGSVSTSIPPVSGARSRRDRRTPQPTMAVAHRCRWRAEFDASTAMYHAVGGVLHLADDTPTLVVRESGPTCRLP